jgi:hypothetical protein
MEASAAGTLRIVATGAEVLPAELMAQRTALSGVAPSLGGHATEAPRHWQLKASCCAPKAPSASSNVRSFARCPLPAQ